MKMIDEADFDYSKFGYKEINKNGIIISSLNVNQDNNRIGFKKGYYRIVSCNNMYLLTDKQLNDLINQITTQLNELFEVLNVDLTKTILICGLGNKDIMADSLGENVCKNILSTRLLKSEIIKSKVCTIAPNVQSVTGIETFDIVSGIANNINAKLIILIDSLMTENVKRIGHSFQMSTCGIVPGGAIKNNKEISFETTNIKCLTIGVPFMLDLKSVSNKINKSIIVSPKDIKAMISLCSKIIADSINILVNPSLKMCEIQELLKPF